MSKGSLMLAWQVKDKHCLVIGGGDVALSRVDHMLKAQAKITVITGSGHIHPSLKQYSEDGKLHQLIERDFQMQDLTMYETGSSDLPDLQYLNLDSDDNKSFYNKIDDMVKNQTFAVVCCCIDDYDLSTKIYYQCKHLRLPVNIADKPPMCDFYFGSMYNRDNLQIMISTNGMSPRLSKKIKDSIAEKFDDIDLNKAVENLGLLRAKLREKLVPNDDLESIDTRMNWIKQVTDFFTIEQWSLLQVDDAMCDKMLSYFPQFPPKEYEFYTDH